MPGEYTGPYYGGDGIVVGAPGENVGSVVDSGLVMSARGLLPNGRFTWTSASNLGTLVPGGRYGGHCLRPEPDQVSVRVVGRMTGVDVVSPAA